MRPLIAKEARNGSKLITEQDIESNVHRISDAVRDKENINIHRIEKYFEENAWLSLLAIMEKKEKCKWTCLKCKAVISTKVEDSIHCDRCLLWCHFQCVPIKKRPKIKNWYCNTCKAKYSS